MIPMCWNFLNLNANRFLEGDLEQAIMDNLHNFLLELGRGYARINPTDKFHIAQRFEYFDDKEARSTGIEQTLKEYTLTFEYAPQPRFITRLEYRRDWATTPFFGCTDCGPLGFKNNQNTITLGMMFILGPNE